jgi:hypothetical protein
MNAEYTIEHDVPGTGQTESPPDLLMLPVKEFLEGFKPPDYIFDGLWRRGYFYSLTAMTGGGKTAVALLASVLASNLELKLDKDKDRRKLGSHEIEHVGVLYIACENSEDVKMRLIGMESRMEFHRDDLDMLVIDKVFDLEKNMGRIRKEVKDYGSNIGLVFIDTSAAMFQGEEENNNTQALRHAKSQRGLCGLPGNPTVVALTHPTKSVERQEQLLPRGGGAYLNETDGNFTLWAHDDRLSTLHWAGKLRGPDFEPITFRLPTIYSTKLVDAKGRLMPTVMAEVVTDAQVEEIEEKALRQEKQLLAAIEARPNGSLTELAKDCGWTLQADREGEPQPNKSLVRRVVTRLTKKGRVEKEGATYTLKANGGARGNGGKAAKKASKQGGDSTRSSRGGE